MKNLKYALHAAAALAAVSLAACSGDDGAEGNPPGSQEAVTLTAWQPGSDSESGAKTRVGFGSDGKAY